MIEIYFDHEKLKVYQKSVVLVAWVSKITKEIKIRRSTIDPLDRADDTIVLNIAEGNGKYSCKDRCGYFDI